MKTVSEILLDLVAIPSVSSMTNEGVIEYALSFLDPDSWAIDLHKYCDGASVEKTNLVAQTRRISPTVAELAFVCHTDTVPYEDSWSEAIHPVIRDGKLYGRGSCDVKGFLACVLVALLQVDPRTLSRPLALVLTADEEVGCIGAKHLVNKNAIRSRFCVIGERNHQGKGNVLLFSNFDTTAGSGRVRCKERLGLLKYYHRDAARICPPGAIYGFPLHPLLGFLGGVPSCSARLLGASLVLSLQATADSLLIQTRRPANPEFGDLDVLIDLTDQEVHLTFVKGRC
jgi:hypothetical protein